MTTKVLGVDLACRTWQDNGTCLMSFNANDTSWDAIDLNCINWPNHELTPAAMAEAVVKFARDHQVVGISLDGPQGWREPNAPERNGVGRVCEYEARCQGKTGEYGKAYPGPQLGWIEFCISVFTALRNLGGHTPTIEDGQKGLTPRDDGQFWIIECFPTSIWRTSSLVPLPGKTRCKRNNVDLSTYRSSLADRYGLPRGFIDKGSHDDLQALIAALPIAGLLRGPAKPVPRGKDCWVSDDGHWVEGVIWDSEPLQSDHQFLLQQPPMEPKPPITNSDTFEHQSNPLLIDERDDSSAAYIDSGIQLFDRLCQLQRQGDAVGVSYSQFAKIVFSVENFSDLAGRNYAQCDTQFVLQLAFQITAMSGGRKSLSRNGITIQAGMDSFIWPQTPPHDRNDAAFQTTPYTKEEWQAIFPDGERRLLRDAE